MKKWEISARVRETGILSTLTRMWGLEDIAAKRDLTNRIASAVNGSAEIISWQWGATRRLFGYDEILLVLRVTTDLTEETLKGAVIAALNRYWTSGLLQVNAEITSIQEITPALDIIRGLENTSVVQYGILGLSSGIVIGIIAFGILRFFNR